MIALKLDGRQAAERVLKKVQRAVARRRRPITLATILVGARYDSGLYVKLKQRAAARVGIRTEAHHLPSNTSQAKLEGLIQSLNRRTAINGILLQLPLPARLHADAAVATIDPKKDVDGFQAKSTAVTPPPIGAVLKLLALGRPLPHRFAIILGQRSIFTERLTRAIEDEGHDAVTVEPHANMRRILTKADIIVTVLGRGPQLHAQDVRSGAIVIDVGIRKHGKRTIGDVHAGVWHKAAAISPVPGGVGPLTIACVLENTVQLATRSQ